ncbi:MAG: NAD-dependent epimerase/dehydratase family protein, partial [SAR324 cluster bacterium]|nr:NAD-dependent epimerase/dehydratase family protein [SAR324 cluster bacterium]
MRVAVTGSSGLIGQALCERLRQEGHTVIRMVRTRSMQANDTCYWNPEIREIDSAR